ncbi:hypothetical protein D6810_01750, partial [Candidatus Dojkabacteria bacterium]
KYNLDKESRTYFHISSSINILEREIEKYIEFRDKRVEIEKQITENVSNIKKIEEKLSVAKKIMDKIDQVQKRIKEFEVRCSNSRISAPDMKKFRLELLNSKMKKPLVSLKNLPGKGTSTKFDFDPFVGEGLLVMTFLQVLITIFFVIKIGFKLEIFVFLVFYIIFNLISLLHFNKLRFVNTKECFIDGSDSKKYSYEQIVGSIDQQTAEFFKNSALLNAMKEEVQNLSQTILNLTGGKTYSELNSDLQKLKYGSLQSLDPSDTIFIQSEDEFYLFERELNISRIKLESVKPPKNINSSELEVLTKIFEFLFKIEYIETEIPFPILVSTTTRKNIESILETLNSLGIDKNVIIFL